MKIFGRIMAYVGTVLGVVVLFLLGVILILEYGPSKSARNLFVNSAMESSAGKFMATLFLPDKTIKEIEKANSVEETEEVTDPELIKIDENKKDLDKIEVIEVSGNTYHGYMAIINDPSKVTVGISGGYSSTAYGRTVADLAKKYDAIIATNAGGFVDINGAGRGGEPLGIVISNGKILWDDHTNTYPLIGLDNNNKLVVGNISANEAINMGVRDALSFGPVLIINGEPVKINGTGGGVNPRTAIGQTKDGTILLVAIEGRQANSLGANMVDLQELFLKHGAVTAANLDGGSSTLMYYQDKYINNCASLKGYRPVPTSIIVKR